MNSTQLQARIDATIAQIDALEDAMLAIASGAMQSYTSDNGQTRIVVTKFNLTEGRKALDSLYNRCTMLEVRLNGGGSFNVRPGF